MKGVHVGGRDGAGGVDRAVRGALVQLEESQLGGHGPGHVHLGEQHAVLRRAGGAGEESFVAWDGRAEAGGGEECGEEQREGAMRGVAVVDGVVEAGRFVEVPDCLGEGWFRREHELWVGGEDLLGGPGDFRECQVDDREAVLVGLNVGEGGPVGAELLDSSSLVRSEDAVVVGMANLELRLFHCDALYALVVIHLLFRIGASLRWLWSFFLCWLSFSWGGGQRPLSFERTAFRDQRR